MAFEDKSHELTKLTVQYAQKNTQQLGEAVLYNLIFIDGFIISTE